MAGTPSEAPRSNEAPSGSGTAWRSGTTVHSAAVPQRRPAAASNSHTPSPTRPASTPPPTVPLADARAVHVRDLEAVDGAGSQPRAGFAVGGVDARGAHPDQDLPW